ncbi:MAG: thioredoxin domain-containing protein [Candidatus Woesearchaeota archaeon]
MRLFTNIIVFFTIVLSLLLVGCGPNQQQLEQFASCLNEKGVVMYGASWCPHCTEQKELFGAAFSKIKYVECVAEENKCTEEGIQFLPTWKFADKSTLTGVMKFSELAQKSGCVLG